MDLKEEFEKLTTKYIDREGVGDLLDWLGSTDFYTAPASTRYHGAVESGLVLHSMNVFSQLLKLCEWYEYKGPKQSVAIVALFHEIRRRFCLWWAWVEISFFAPIIYEAYSR